MFRSARSVVCSAAVLLCVMASAAHGQAAPAAAPVAVPPVIDATPPQLPPPAAAASASASTPAVAASGNAAKPGAVYASTTPAASAPAASPLPGNPTNEPSVKRNVVEDDNARIDELNVRGAVRSISVTPKGPIKTPYEVLPTDASSDPSEGPGSTKGAQGRRVWRVLSF